MEDVQNPHFLRASYLDDCPQDLRVVAGHWRCNGHIALSQANRTLCSSQDFIKADPVWQSRDDESCSLRYRWLTGRRLQDVYT